MIQQMNFAQLVLCEPRPVLLRVIYVLPDFSHLVNVFVWQTMDIVPSLPRVHRFLGFWRNHIEAVIKEVAISHGPAPTWRQQSRAGRNPRSLG